MAEKKEKKQKPAKKEMKKAKIVSKPKREKSVKKKKNLRLPKAKVATKANQPKGPEKKKAGYHLPRPAVSPAAAQAPQGDFDKKAYESIDIKNVLSKDMYENLKSVENIFQTGRISEPVSEAEIQAATVGIGIPKKPRKAKQAKVEPQAASEMLAVAEPKQASEQPTQISQPQPPVQVNMIEPKIEAAPVPQQQSTAAPEVIKVEVPQPKIENVEVTPEPQQQPQKVEKPPVYARASRTAKALGTLKQAIFGSRMATPLEANARKQLIPFTAKAGITKDFIKENMATLKDVAKTNESVADILKHIEDPKYQKGIEEISQKLVSGEEIFATEMKEIIGYFENVASGLEDVGVQLGYGVPEIIKSAQEIIKNSNIDLKTKRDALDTLVGILDQQKVQSDSFETLKKLSKEQINFSEAQVGEIGSLTDMLSGDEKVKDKKIFGTYAELNKKLGSILLNIKDWKEFSEEKDDTDHTMKEGLLSRGLGAVGTGAKQGLLDAALAAVGLPGLGHLLGQLGFDPLKGVGGLVKGAGKGIGAIGGVLGGMGEGSPAIASMVKGFTSMSKVMGPVAEGIESLLGPIGTLAAQLAVFGSAIYGAVKGIMNTLDEWKQFFVGIFDLGKSLFNFFERLYHAIFDITEEFQKAHPILSAFLDGIKTVVETLVGLPVLIVKKIAEGFENIFGWLGVGAGKAGGMFESLAKGLDSLLPDKTKAPAVAQEVDKTSNIAPGIATENAQVGPTVNTLTGGAPSIKPVPFATKSVLGKATPSPVELNPQSLGLAKTQYSEDRATQRQIAESSGRPIVVQSPAPERRPEPSVRKNQIDDLSIALLKTGLLYP